MIGERKLLSITDNCAIVFTEDGQGCEDCKRIIGRDLIFPGVN